MLSPKVTTELLLTKSVNRSVDEMSSAIWRHAFGAIAYRTGAAMMYAGYIRNYRCGRPADTLTSLHFRYSAAIKSPNAAGVDPVSITPEAVRRSRT